jgi:hexosaminidase
MYRRLGSVSLWLEQQGLEHRTQLRVLLQTLAGNRDVTPLEIFASVLEPTKGYKRHDAKPYKELGSQMAFNRVVDAIPPESDAAREFNAGVDRFLTGHSNEDAAAVRKQLAAWRDNLSAVQPILRSSQLLAEQMEVASAIAELCKLGIEAVDALKNGTAMAGAQAGALGGGVERIKELGKAKADMLIQIAPGVQRMVEALPH